MYLIGISAIVPQTARDFSKIFVECYRVWLAVVPRLNSRKRLGVFFNEGGEFEEEVSARSGGEIAPGGRLECFPGSRNGDINVVSRSCVDRGDFGLITARCLALVGLAHL